MVALSEDDEMEDEENEDSIDRSFLEYPLRLALSVAEIETAVADHYSSNDGVVQGVRYDPDCHELLVDVEISLESGMEAMSSDEWLGTTVVEISFKVTPR